MDKVISFLKTWLGQSTTGQGIAGLGTAVAAVAGGAITPHEFLLAMVPTVLLIMWPEATTIAPLVPPVINDVEKIAQAYALGRTHGTAGIVAAEAPLVSPALADVVKLLQAAAHVVATSAATGVVSGAGMATTTASTTTTTDTATTTAPVPVAVVGYKS
jgi:hypothetical protein